MCVVCFVVLQNVKNQTTCYDGRMKYQSYQSKSYPWDVRETSPYSHDCATYVSPDDFRDQNFENYIKGLTYDRKKHEGI